MKKILILSNHFINIHRLRLELVVRLKMEYEVYIVLPEDENDFFKNLGCNIIKTKINRHGINPFEDLRLMFNYFKTIKKVSPDVVLTYTVKPNVYGGICCKMLNKPVFQNVTGLGTAINGGGLVRVILLALYKLALNNSKCIFVQNEDNLSFLKQNKIKPLSYRKIPGSGVNLTKYNILEYPQNDTINFLFIARVMKSKGIDEFISAAQHFKGRNVKFHVLGFCEEGYEERLKQLDDDGVLIYHGMVDDVIEFHKIAHCTINPSYHEGMSNVLLEASACARPCLCSNIPGCKEIVEDGKSGFLFEAQNSMSLIEAIDKFLSLSREKQKEMGLYARSKVESEFSRDIVVNAYIDEIEKALEKSKENARI